MRKDPMYIDAFVLAVPKKNMPAYLRIARLAGKVWRDHGALEYRECAGEDLTETYCPGFPRILKLKRGETAFFSWIVYKSRAHRDKVNAKVMKDPRLGKMMGMKMPFDMKRMSHGGFDIVVDM
jgi:uncharacterized protein YbaA (DUF1428 family)